MSDLLQAWIGKKQTQSDVITVKDLTQMAATFDWPASPYVQGVALPPLAHLFFCNDDFPARDLDPDGAACKGQFMPPIELPRRMWAGSDIRFSEPLRVGDTVECETEIVAINKKAGKSGDLYFVELDRRFVSSSGGRMVERRTIVYRGAAQSPTPWTQGLEKPELDPQRAYGFTPDEIMLFRFSALTWNAHRIHFDRSFCQESEAYPDIVVHGPLLAFLAAQAAQHGSGFDTQTQRAKTMSRFVFKALQPCFVNKPVSVQANPDGTVQVCNFAGELAMSAQAFWNE